MPILWLVWDSSEEAVNFEEAHQSRPLPQPGECLMRRKHRL